MGRAEAGEIVGAGRPARADDIAAVAGGLLTTSTGLPADVVLRAGLVWPVLQHAAWLWRVASPGDDPAVAWALSLQLRSDLFRFLELALEAYDLGANGAPVGRSYARIRRALAHHHRDEDDVSRLPPSLPVDPVLEAAVRRWPASEIPGDLLVKCQLFTAVTYARLDGFTRREVVDVFAAVLDELVPNVLDSYGRGSLD